MIVTAMTPDNVLTHCRGCGSAFRARPGDRFCFTCDLGLDRGDSPGPVIAEALALHAKLGPAGGTGLRMRAIATRGRKRRTKK